MDGLRGGAGSVVASVTHAAGLSSTGDPAIDAALPLPERYEVPAATAARGARRRAPRGGRVIAVGTTVVRALEGAAADGGGRLAGRRADGRRIRIGAGFRPRVVDALLTGLHEPGESHFELLRAFAPDGALQAALDHAEPRGLSDPRVRRLDGCHMTIRHDEARNGARGADVRRSRPRAPAGGRARVPRIRGADPDPA